MLLSPLCRDVAIQIPSTGTSRGMAFVYSKTVLNSPSTVQLEAFFVAFND